MRYLTSDLAKLLGVTPNTIRRYEKSGFLKPGRDVSNYRWYESRDIDRAAMVRLYIKCGFSHKEIRAMMNGESDDIKKICSDKLNEMDSQIERLTRLRHWLKDNIQLMDTVKELKDSYIFMKCPALIYTVYNIDDNILKERERLVTLNNFMYRASEVQLINLFRFEDIKRGVFSPHTGWAFKEMDIEKLHMEEVIRNNKYIEYYPSRESLYWSVEIPAEDIDNGSKANAIRTEAFMKAKKYAESRGYCIDGDIAEIIVNIFGSNLNLLEGIPVEKINKDPSVQKKF